MTGDKVQAKEYMVRFDGVTLYRFAVPNIKDEETGEWVEPKFKIKQDQTGLLYDAAIDVEGKGYTYTETDIPIEGDTGDLTVDDTLAMLNQMGVDTDDQ